METNNKHGNNVLRQKQDAEKQIAQILYDLEFNTGMKVDSVEYLTCHEQTGNGSPYPFAEIKLTI